MLNGRERTRLLYPGWPDCKASVLCAKPCCLLMERIANGGISDVETVLWEEVLDRWFPIGPLPQASRAEGCWCRRSSILLPPFCCVWDARQVPSGLLTIPRQPFGLAWVTCMSSASQQPCGGVSQGRVSALAAWQCQGRRGRRGVLQLPATRPPSCAPTPAPLRSSAEAQARMNVAELGTLVRPVPVAAALLSCH